ncbi:MAG: LytTR family DNA-binding domain-containing protein [Candidatus Eisenbacteria bacterium]|nr:LytTR family DNA-binding domain-containing protein [Candidatus Eisenbacteria bacterium]
MSAPIRTLLVDDEPLARTRLRRMLGELGGIEVVGEAGSVAEALVLVESLRPDLLFLDVQMPGEDGFALLPRLTHRPAIVFATAFDQHAVRAFEESAIDYLLKPFRTERLARAIQRARASLARPDDLARQMQQLLASMEAARNAPATEAIERFERFTVRVGQKQLIIKASDVLWFGAEDKLVFAATASERHYINYTLDDLERRLDPAKFARVHRSAIANLDHAAALRPGFAGTWRLQLDDAARTELPVARSRARAIKARLGA